MPTTATRSQPTATPAPQAPSQRLRLASILAVAFLAHGTALSTLAARGDTARAGAVSGFIGTTTVTTAAPAASPLVPVTQPASVAPPAAAPAPTPAPTPAAPAPAPTPAPTPAAPAPVSPAKWLPTGKGMWIYQPAATEGGNVAAIVAKAKATGLTHLWVRLGSAWDGFNVAPFLDRLLPAAHAAGIKVIGWDFPKLDPVSSDVDRALTMIRHAAPSGDRIDAFSADIETQSEGTHLSQPAGLQYGSALRAGAGDAYPLIATVPRPSKDRPGYPFAQVTASFDAIAPMVYWLNRQPDTDVTGALADLAVFGKPILPVGQAYDGGPEGGRKGVPPPSELQRFMNAAADHGATEISFWSWQAANQAVFDTVRDAPQFGPVVTARVDPPSP